MTDTILFNTNVGLTQARPKYAASKLSMLMSIRLSSGQQQNKQKVTNKSTNSNYVVRPLDIVTVG